MIIKHIYNLVILAVQSLGHNYMCMKKQNFKLQEKKSEQWEYYTATKMSALKIYGNTQTPQ